MLQLISSKQLILNPKSDETLTGSITIANNSKGCFIPYKVKSTNPALFSVEPSRGSLSQSQSQTIHITTIDAINSALAKEISHKHKFLIEYVVLDRQPRSVEDAIGKISGQTLQSFRIYINTDSIRNSRIRQPNRRDSEIGSSISKTYSFHSVHNEGRKTSAPNDRGIFKNNLATNAHLQSHHHPDSLERVESEVDYLERERSSLLVGSGKKKPKSTGAVKKLIIIIIGLVVGNLGAKAVGLTEASHSFFSFESSESGFFSSEPQESSGWF